MFSIGEKAVYVGPNLCPEAIVPQIHEIVTIDGFSSVYDDSVYLSEYTYSKKGRRQSFLKSTLRKLDYAHTENIIREICELAKEEELVNH